MWRVQDRGQDEKGGGKWEMGDDSDSRLVFRHQRARCPYVLARLGNLPLQMRNTL